MRLTVSPGESESAMASFGETGPRPRWRKRAEGTSPRVIMSSVKLERRESGCSTCMRAAMKVPEPQRCTSSPSSTSPAMALRTVTREMPSSRARSRSLGRASSAFSAPLCMAERIACWSWR